MGESEGGSPRRCCRSCPPLGATDGGDTGVPNVPPNRWGRGHEPHGFGTAGGIALSAPPSVQPSGFYWRGGRGEGRNDSWCSLPSIPRWDEEFGSVPTERQCLAMRAAVTRWGDSTELRAAAAAAPPAPQSRARPAPREQSRDGGCAPGRLPALRSRCFQSWEGYGGNPPPASMSQILPSAR